MDMRNSTTEGSEVSEERRGQNLNCLREHLDHRAQTVSGDRALKALLARTQKEMRNMLLKTGGKGIFVIWEQTAQLSCVLQLCRKQNL